MNIARILCASTLLLAALPAQGKPSPFRFVPADSIAVVRLAAPAAWKQQFATAQIIKWFQCDALAPLVGMASQGIDEGIGMLRQSGKFDADLLEKMLNEYKGEIVLSFQVDLEGLMAAIQSGEDPPVSMTMALLPDGSFDLGALAKAAEKAIDEDAPPTRDMTVGDHKLRGMLDDGGDGITVPTMIDGALVVFGGDGLDKSLPKLLANEGRWQGDASPHALSVEFKLGSAIAMFGNFVDEMEQAPFSIAMLMGKMGLNAIDRMSFQIDADGQHVAMDAKVDFGEGDRGMFAAMMGTGAPKLLRYAPPASETFTAMTFKLGVIYDMIASIWKDLGDDVPMTLEDAEKAFAEAAKVRLKEDLIAHLGDEMLFLQDLSAMSSDDFDPDDPTSMLKGTCAAIALKDGKAFGESLETALWSRGLHAARKTEEYQGTKVYRMAGLFEFEYAITDDVLLVGLGGDDTTRQALRGVLDARKAPADGVPAAAKAGVETMPAGWSGISHTAMSQYLGLMLKAMAAGASQGRGMPEEMEMVLGALGKAVGELKRLGLDSLVSAIYTTDKGIHARYRW